MRTTPSIMASWAASLSDGQIQMSYRGTKRGPPICPWRTCPEATRLVLDWYRTGTRCVGVVDDDVEDVGEELVSELCSVKP